MNYLIKKTLDHPWIAILITLILSMSVLLVIPKLNFDADLANLIPSNDPVIKHLKEATEVFGSQSLILLVLKTDNIYNPATLAKIDDLAQSILEVEGVIEVVTPLDAEIVVSSEWGMEVVSLTDTVPQSLEEIDVYQERLTNSPYKDILISQDAEAAIIMVKPSGTLEPGTESRLAGKLAQIAKNHQGPEEIYVVGDVYGAYYAEEAMKKDVLVLTPLVFIVLAAVLYFGLRSVRGVLLPMSTVAIAALWAVGLMASVGIKMSIITVLVPIILLAIGSAQGIHIINRYYGYLHKGLAKKEALEATMADLTSPILMTSLTTVAGFVSLVSSPIPPIKHFGLITGFGVVIAMLVSLFFIPSMLSLLKGMEPKKLQKTNNTTKIIGRLGGSIAKHPFITITLYTVLVLFGILGSFRLQTEGNMLRYFEKNSPVIKGTDIVEEKFGGTLQLSVVVDTGVPDGVKEPEVLKKLEKIENFLETVPNMSYSHSLATVVKEINKAFTDGSDAEIPETKEAIAQELLLYSLQGGSSLEYLTSYDYSQAVVTARVLNSGSGEIKNAIKMVEDFLQAEFSQDQDLKVTLTGMPKVIYRVMDQFAMSQITSLFTSSLAVATIVAIIMKSILLGFLSILPLVVTIALNFGIMGFTGIPLDGVTSMIAGIAIGIGVDYSIHYLSTFRKEASLTDDLKKMVTNTGDISGSGIYLNALTLFLGFLVLVVSNFRAIKLFGFLTAMTMLVSSFTALTLLPAILVVLERKKIQQRQLIKE